MIGMRMVQMAIVEIVNVIAVPNRGMTATRPMLMRMIGVMWKGARCHGAPL